jgi:type IV secretory pathway TraG/TraD family ATPase VirD4
VGVIPGLPEIISTARSKGIQMQMVLQTPTQLEYVYGEAEAKTILGNCPTVMLIGIAPADRELAQMFSEKLGNAAVETDRISEDMTIPGKHLFEFKKKIRTVIQRPLMTMDEILRMDPRDCMALMQWSYPAILRKVGWPDLPQAEQIKNCGMMPVEEVIPSRPLDIEMPGIEECESHVCGEMEASVLYATSGEEPEAEQYENKEKKEQLENIGTKESEDPGAVYIDAQGFNVSSPLFNQTHILK